MSVSLLLDAQICTHKDTHKGSSPSLIRGYHSPFNDWEEKESFAWLRMQWERPETLCVNFCPMQAARDTHTPTLAEGSSETLDSPNNSVRHVHRRSLASLNKVVMYKGHAHTDADWCSSPGALPSTILNISIRQRAKW